MTARAPSPSPPHPSSIKGGCLCAALRYTISFPSPETWPPNCSACQCTKCRKWLSSLEPIALTIPLENFDFPSGESGDKSWVRTWESSPGCERTFCGRCGSGITFRSLAHMPRTTELWIGTLDEDVLIGTPLPDQAGNEARGQKVHRRGGFGAQLAQVRDTLYWNNAIPSVTDQGPARRGRKWWGMIGQGESFV